MSIDDVARRVAEPMPRRRALGVIGGAVAALLVGGLRPRRARADGDCLPGHTLCQSNPGGFNVCCNDATEDCVNDGLHICRTKPTPCPAGTSHCGGRYDFSCCDPGWECRDSVCIPGCPPGASRCGQTCCGKGQQCAGGRCVKRCPPGRARCGTRCCPKGERCADARRGICAQCPPRREPCGKKCCGAGQFCCNPRKGLCCRKAGGECCFADPQNMEGSGLCCQAPNGCAREGDLNGANVPGRGNVCCPPARQAADHGACCPPGSTAHKVSLVGVGIPLACCPNDRFCGDTCLARAPGSGVDERCCDGIPRNVASDPANCGACGNQCAAGQGCFSGVCA